MGVLLPPATIPDQELDTRVAAWKAEREAGVYTRRRAYACVSVGVSAERVGVWEAVSVGRRFCEWRGRLGGLGAAQRRAARPQDRAGRGDTLQEQAEQAEQGLHLE